MLTVKLICVGKLKEKFYIDAAAEYQKRLKGSCRLEVIELPEQKLPQEAGRSPDRRGAGQGVRGYPGKTAEGGQGSGHVCGGNTHVQPKNYPSC